MTTSGSTDFSITRDNIIKDALVEIGAFDPYDTLDATSDEAISAIRMLNMMVKNWQVIPGLWLTKDVQHTLTPGTESYTVGTGLNIDTARPLKLISCHRENSTGVEIQVDVVSREEYKNIPVKNTQQPVSMVYYDPQLSNGVLYVWPTGISGNVIINLTFQRPIDDFDATGDTPDFPQEWYLPLIKNLAVLLQRSYQGRSDPDLKLEAAILLEGLIQFNSEPCSVMFSPSIR